MDFVAVDRRAPVLRRPIDAATIDALCRAALGPSARLAGCALLGSGHFNTTYRLDLEHRPPVVLRLGPEAGAPLWRHERGQMARECSVQPLLRALGDAIPRLLHADFSQRLVARHWMLAEHRAGEVWELAMPRIGQAANDALWRAYGELVARLHALRGDRFGFPAPAARHARFSSWFVELVDGLAEDLAEQRIVVAGLAGFRSKLDRERARLDDGVTPRLVHGDLWPRNVLVAQASGGWKIAALLDAERAFFGDTSAEWIFGFLDIPAAFWAGYGQRLADADLGATARWRRRAYQARGALQMILEGRRFGFDAAFAHRQFARFSAELSAIDAAPRAVHA
ncbi:MAG TPA: phosphotransferase [Rubrivivax sp.]|nr:phosphotransferase [Rubrivivax sp.]HPP82059.1 phosphotransferase [Rubrivivax sp.]